MRFHSKPIEEHAEVPLGDEGRLERLIARWDARRPGTAAEAAGSACYVLSVYRPEHRAAAEAQLGEITGLVLARGDRVVGSESYKLTAADPRTLLRSGVAERVGEHARAHGADMLVLDAELSPSQARNLEAVAGLPICDREAVILSVFERRASSRRARLQVEIARLEYLRPRIRGLGLDMDQQVGGLSKARGPGETASELLARRLDGRLADLRTRLAQIKRADETQRKHRKEAARVALVGYTNAGKTSLMNALTAAGLSARDRPFETLETTSRALSRDGGDVLLSDTVGFIRRLPERLFASFESTLAEVSEAALLLVVVDAADPEAAQHIATTREVLDKLEAGHVPRLVVFNKLDRALGLLDADSFAALSLGDPYVALCSRDLAAVAELKQRVLALVRAGDVRREVFVPYARAELTRRVYAECRVLSAIAGPRGTQFVLEGKPEVVDALARASRRLKS